ncbi:MAG: DNA (cytosine-5-)-methyltransferase [Flavobacteriaceae bacterium]|nr:MAG: DNA (cytosine-5-)-methyltransferase [Flavobacteriaceae bacterium]
MGAQMRGTFIDLFAGCGGFSLGLMNAGWQGLFAVEKDSMAFETLCHNLVDNERFSHTWPSWLKKEPTTIENLLDKHSENLKLLNRKVDLIVGGPPCQGFSMLGLRNSDDPRNKLTEKYLEVVSLIQPKYIILENVKGFATKFDSENKEEHEPYSEIVKRKFDELGYDTTSMMVSTDQWGVPQRRTRFILLAIRKDLNQSPQNVLQKFESSRHDFLKDKGLPTENCVTVFDAIADLETKGKVLVPVTDVGSLSYQQIKYFEPKNLSNYAKMMRKGSKKESPNSLRLTKHRPATIEKFQKILNTCGKGKNLTNADRERLGIKKQVIVPLAKGMVSPTVTTLPDDILHYSEPRILTVRENARLQSFPDWYEFRGKYTTGGKLRTQECPRYTQVGNAVPPLLGEALGLLLGRLQTNA